MRPTQFLVVAVTLSPLLANAFSSPSLQARAAYQRHQFSSTGVEGNEEAGTCSRNTKCNSQSGPGFEQLRTRALTEDERKSYIAAENGASGSGDGEYVEGEEEEEEEYKPDDTEETEDFESQEEAVNGADPDIEEVEPYEDSYTGTDVALKCQPPIASERCQFGSYTVKKGDACSTIGPKYSVPYTGIVTVNDLDPGCRRLRIGSVICLPPRCLLYRVQPGDSCISIAKAKGLSIEDFRINNPTINNACSNLREYIDICLTPPGYM